MNIAAYVGAFAELLEKGVLLVKEDVNQNVQLKPEDYDKHVLIAAMLRKAINSPVMADMVNDFHKALNNIAAEKQMLEKKIVELTAQLTGETQAAPVEAAAPATEENPAEQEAPAAKTE